MLLACYATVDPFPAAPPVMPHANISYLCTNLGVVEGDVLVDSFGIQVDRIGRRKSWVLDQTHDVFVKMKGCV